MYAIYPWQEGCMTHYILWRQVLGWSQGSGEGEALGHFRDFTKALSFLKGYTVWSEFWWEIYFGRLVVLRAICQYLIHQKTSQCDVIIIAKSQLSYVLGLQLDAPVKLSAWSSPLKAEYKDITYPKSFVDRRWEKGWLVCQYEEGDPNDVYGVAVKTDATKTVQIKCNSNCLVFSCISS